MSLTSILNTKKARKMFREAVPNPGLVNRNVKIKIPRKTERPNVMGAAYDYLLRFALMRHYPIAKDKTWVAWQAICELKDALPAEMFTCFLLDYGNAEYQYQRYL